MRATLNLYRGLGVHQSKLWAALALLIILYLPTTAWPALSGLNPAQVKAVLILLLAALLWVSEWLPLFIVSFIILALELLWLSPALTQLGQPIGDALFFAPFFSNIILLFLGGFVLSSLMQKAGLDARFAHWILQLTQGEPTTTLAGIIAACAFLSMWMSNTATAAMMLTMVLPLAQRLRTDTPFRVGLILSIPLACNLGGIGTPIWHTAQRYCHELSRDQGHPSEFFGLDDPHPTLSADSLDAALVCPVEGLSAGRR